MNNAEDGHIADGIQNLNLRQDHDEDDRLNGNVDGENADNDVRIDIDDNEDNNQQVAANDNERNGAAGIDQRVQDDADDDLLLPPPPPDNIRHPQGPADRHQRNENVRLDQRVQDDADDDLLLPPPPDNIRHPQGLAVRHQRNQGHILQNQNMLQQQFAQANPGFQIVDNVHQIQFGQNQNILQQQLDQANRRLPNVNAQQPVALGQNQDFAQHQFNQGNHGLLNDNVQQPLDFRQNQNIVHQQFDQGNRRLPNPANYPVRRNQQQQLGFDPNLQNLRPDIYRPPGLHVQYQDEGFIDNGRQMVRGPLNAQDLNHRGRGGPPQPGNNQNDFQNHAQGQNLRRAIGIGAPRNFEFIGNANDNNGGGVGIVGEAGQQARNLAVQNVADHQNVNLFRQGNQGGMQNNVQQQEILNQQVQLNQPVQIVNNQQDPAVNPHHNLYRNNYRQQRYTPYYMNTKRMSQNAKKMAMMVWSMAQASMYEPNPNNQHRFNNQNRNRNFQDDDDDVNSQYAP